MQSFFYKLRQWMYGRYGVDQLSVAIVIFSMAVSFILLFFRVPYIVRLIPTLLIILAFFRILSRNIEKRRRENQRFMQFFNRSKTEYYTVKTQVQDRKYFKYFKCPNCKAKLRVPKGKGRLNITCPKCRTMFHGKT